MAGQPKTLVLKTSTHGTICIRPPINGAPGAPLLMGFHGYAETADAMLERLMSVPGAGAWALCAVEGLHLFYSRRSQSIVASWMTKKNRERAIHDNLAYVNKAVARARVECGAGDLVVYAGFSQGVAMAARAAALGADEAAGLILLGGDWPPDLDADPAGRVPPLLYGRGDQDELYPADQFEKDLRTVKQLGLHATVARFAGGHEWNAAFSRKVAAFLRTIKTQGQPPAS